MNAWTRCCKRCRGSIKLNVSTAGASAWPLSAQSVSVSSFISQNTGSSQCPRYITLGCIQNLNEVNWYDPNERKCQWWSGGEQKLSLVSPQTQAHHSHGPRPGLQLATLPVHDGHHEQKYGFVYLYITVRCCRKIKYSFHIGVETRSIAMHSTLHDVETVLKWARINKSAERIA